ncbi:MAG: hypothetical protein FJZ16_06505 [Candidatus Omnitrophica bacterium]|nr:hypothetical protein [Candidatus Omnitrophota bacterium]
MNSINRKGFVLLVSVILLFITSAVGAAGLLLMVGHYQTTKIQIDHVKAYYRSEAGLIHKMWRMRNGVMTATETISVESANDVTIRHTYRSTYGDYSISAETSY